MIIKSSLHRNHCVEKLLGIQLNILAYYLFFILVENIIHIETENIFQRENLQTDTPLLALTENSSRLIHNNPEIQSSSLHNCLPLTPGC